MLLLLLLVEEEVDDPPRKLIISESFKISPPTLKPSLDLGTRTNRLDETLLYVTIAKESIVETFGIFPADTTIAFSNNKINISDRNDLSILWLSHIFVPL